MNITQFLVTNGTTNGGTHHGKSLNAIGAEDVAAVSHTWGYGLI